MDGLELFSYPRRCLASGIASYCVSRLLVCRGLDWRTKMKSGCLGQMAVGSGDSGMGKTERRVKGWSWRMLGFGVGLALVWGAAGCHKTTAQGAAQNAAEQYGGDPANVNMAGDGNGAPGQPAQVLGQSSQNEAQQQAEEYSQQPPAPIERRAPYSGDQSYGNPGSPNQGYNDPGYPNQGYDNGSGLSDDQAADLYASDLTDGAASEPPPPLPDYDQPPAPDPDYLWTPGYWAWSPMGYYWVPGCWVAAPYVGALWTPGYWGFIGGRYRFHHGFWGLHIGFYGGIDYGFGYTGYGYYGGYWDHDHFRYNTAVNRVNINVIRNVYTRDVYVNNQVVNNRIVNRVSFNGGRGGVQVQPRPAEVAVLHEQRHAPMQSQVQVQRDASQNRQQFFNQNQGRPAVAVSAGPVVADRTPLAVLPRAAGPAVQPGVRNDMRPGQGQPQVRQGQPQQGQFRQGQPQVQPQVQGRQGQPQPEVRQPQQQGQPQPQFRQGQRQGQPQPQVRQVPQRSQPQPQPQVRQAQPQPQVRQAQPQPQPQVRQAPPQPQVRQAPPPQPQPQARPQPQPAPQAHPAPQSHPAPPAKRDDHPDDKPRR